MKKLYLWSVFLMLVGVSCEEKQATQVQELTVEMRTNPIGLDVSQPRFNWMITQAKPNTMQTAYRVVVAGSAADLKGEQNLLWDSGTVTSDQSTFVTYAGTPLESRKTYFWKVFVTTSQGDSLWSKPAQWTMALLDSTDWKAQWIGTDSLIGPNETLEGNTRVAARYLRKEFTVDKKIESAMLYISGLGLYECYLNGQKVSQDIFAPTASDYHKQVYYNTYDVQSFIRDKQNTLGVVLGNGRYVALRSQGHYHFGMPKLLAQLEITYTDGSQSVIVSDESWKLTANGPIVANNEFDGEEYDANKEMKDWSKRGFDDQAWMNAQVVGAPAGKLSAQLNPNIATMEQLTPKSIKQLNDSTYVLDMGQNMVGWLAVTLKGQKDRPIRMRFSETLKDNDSLYMANLRGAKVTDIYTPSSDRQFTWEPRFVYHGFRFVEITGLSYKPELKNFKGKVNYDEMEKTGSIQTSNEMLNQIYHNAVWGIKGNYRSTPTDCPQRDERMGWLGDRAMGCFGESFIFRQTLLYEKWLRDIEQSQASDGNVPDVAPLFWSHNLHSGNVTWPAAYPCIVNMLYEQYGDVRPIKEHYASLKRWMNFIRDTKMQDDLVMGDVYGDWCMPPESPELIWSADPARKTDGVILGTSFYYRLLNLMAKFAALSGNEADVPEYQALAARIKTAYNQKFLDPVSGQYGNNTVTANIISLMQGLVPDSLTGKIVDQIVSKTTNEFDSHVSTGLIGIQFLMRGLTKYNHGDLAYTIATNETYPSWGYMVNKGATTIWELWNGDTANPEMNSGNHVMLLGDLVSWYYENLGGIKSDPQQVGFKRIIMEPYFPEGLKWVKASHKSLYGTIRSAWTKSDTGLEWKISIPANSTASIRIPADNADQITENGQPLAQNNTLKVGAAEGGFVTLEAGSGNYTFKVTK